MAIYLKCVGAPCDDDSNINAILLSKHFCECHKQKNLEFFKINAILVLINYKIN